MAIGKQGRGTGHLGTLLGTVQVPPVRADSTTKTADTTALTADNSK